MQGAADLAFALAMATTGRSALRRLLRAADAPEAAQLKTLRAIVRWNAATAFGRAHRFAEIRDVDRFRAAVPISDYEGLRPWIDRQIAGEPAVTSAKPIMYARTSGTTAEPKRVPVTTRTLDQMKRAQRAMAYVQHRACPIFSGKILALGGAMREETLPDGTPAGAVTGLIYETMPLLVRRKYVVPPEVFAIKDAELKYRVVTRLALQHADLTAVSTANPSTLLRLRDYSRAHWANLLAEIATGAFAEAEALPRDQAAAIRRALFPAPARARALDEAAHSAEPTIADLWPKLAGVVTWTGGSCALAADAVRRALPATTMLIEAGYVASELRGTVVVDPARGLALPVLEDVFFEFVRADQWDAGCRDTLLLHELEVGCDYQVIVTTTGGLARYWINDVLRTGPAIGSTPTLSFVRKGRGVTNITGEKLTEEQVNVAMGVLAHRFDCDVPFHLMLADEMRSVYIAAVELDRPVDAASLAGALEAELCRLNIEYASKRSSGRLAALEIRLLGAGTGAAYRRWCVAKGQREAQFKVLALQYVRECSFDFSPWLSP
jgi:GH3 auxin-responsive promoter